MTKFRPIITSLAIWTYICCIAASSLQCQAQEGASSTQDTCTSDDLNHSILVECSASNCGDSSFGREESSWPTKPDEIIHIQSTRAGERFSQKKLANLNLIEDHTTKLLNINTTLNVNFPRGFVSPVGQQLIGFGATLNANELAAALQAGLFDRLFCLVLDDLFGQASSSVRFNLLRLRVNKEFHIEQRNLSQVLLALDSQPKKHSASSRIKMKLVIEFEDQPSFSRELDSLAGVRSSLTNTELWGLALLTDGPLKIHKENLIPGVNLLASTTLTHGRETLSRTPSGEPDAGAHYPDLLAQVEPSVPYEVLDNLVSELASDSGKRVITLGQSQSKAKDYGDWDSANQVSVQILNHLRHGSLGYIEDQSIVEVLAHSSSGPAEQRDASLYSLHHSHGVHFRGPRFYAIGHFSRYLKPGSNRLDVDLFTQPNMFAAHYAAFLSPDRKHVVGVVLNDNEHLLPFRMAINNVVMAFTGLQPKSFNTFLIKLDE